MHLVSEGIEKYCLAHSSKPSDICEEIERYTWDNVELPQMVSGPLVSVFIGFLLRLSGAKRVLEFGTFTGYSALAMAENLPDEGQLITLDINPETNKIAKSFWAKSPHGKKIDARIGDAHEIVKSLRGPFDLVFIDADKTGYQAYAEYALQNLSPTGLIVADNCLWSGDVIDEKNDERATKALRKFNQWATSTAGLTHVLIPLRDGLHLIRKA